MVDWFSIFRRKVDARTPSRKHTEETAAEDVERSCKYPNEESSMLESENGNEIPQDYCSHGNGGQIELCKENDDTGIKMEKEETATKKCGCCRTRRGRIKILVWTLVGLSVTFLILVIVISSGMLYEQAQVRKAEQAFNSLGLYTTNRVCGILQPEEQPLRIQTYDNVSQVLALQANGTNVTVAHCGDCGHCSNPQDIKIYDDTRNTLFQESLDCAKKGVFGGYDAAYNCLVDNVGMTKPCTKCWAENIQCDLKKCVFSCFYQRMFLGGIHGGSQSETLNRCTRCDEIICGPAFVECAGANRRRTGIQSDIQRDAESEVCTKVQPKEWWQDPVMQNAWYDGL